MSWVFFYYVRYNYNHFFYFYLDLMCDVLGIGPVYYYTGPVTFHTGTVTTILDPVLSMEYRYQLMFLYWDYHLRQVLAFILDQKRFFVGKNPP